MASRQDLLERCKMGQEKLDEVRKSLRETQARDQRFFFRCFVNINFYSYNTFLTTRKKSIRTL